MCAATFAPDTAAAKKAPKKQIAIQLYSVRDLIGSFGQNQHDYTDVLQALGKMGYTAVEAASYNDGKFYGKTPEAFKADVEAAGMEVLSSHTTRNLSEEELASGDFSQAMKWWDECIAAHKAAGMKYLVTPSMPMLKTLGELQRYCDYFNEIGKRCRENGILYGYHNHAFEFQKIEDRVMLEYMIEHTDPANVFFQMDVYWTVIGKASPVDLFHKYPGRFRMLHIKDLREIGQSGMVGFDAIFRNTDVAGVEQIVVEVEQYSYDVEKSVRMSLEYLLEAPFVKASYSK
ncbi:sugar phosphate isomerase/epimerase [Alistipes sp.]|uniref:sugar phosphate isomerase/epimerase family protein n=1 Tax=Alistipes sp. TaxID=1872444 RepID=UPI0025B8CC9A|nr:sugar phosphate isomerase/epimerase [Alistipes sp.]